jgi:hypothetical protein
MRENLACLMPHQSGVGSTNLDQARCWEETISADLVKPFSLEPGYAQIQPAIELAVPLMGMVLGFLGLATSLTALYQRHRLIQYQRQISVLERLWLDRSLH